MDRIEALTSRWLAAGVEPADTLLVHSSIKRTLGEFRQAGHPISPDDILRSFLEAIGPRGTLLLPLFNFDFAKGVPFDIQHTPSQMGALTEAGRVHKEAVRTGHPIYSFAVIGHQSKDFEQVDNESGYSDDSPFGMLRRMNGKIASLDLDDQNSMTFYHHVEEVKQVDYRYFKTFVSEYRGRDGIWQEKSYKLYVRDIDRGVLTQVNPAGELLWKHGLYRGDMPMTRSGLRVIKCQPMFEFVSDLIERGQALGTLYALANQA